MTSTPKRLFGTRGANVGAGKWQGEDYAAQLADQLRRTALLTRVSLELRAAREPHVVVEQVLSIIHQNTEADQASIILVAADGSVESATALINGRVELMASADARRMLDDGLAGYALRQGRAIVVPDVRLDARWVPIDGARAIGSVLVTVLTHAQTTLGVLTIAHRATGRFGGQDLLLIEGVAAQAGVALSAARSFAYERRRREQAFQLFAMSQYLAGERSMGELAEALLDKSMAVFDASAVGLFLTAARARELTCFSIKSGTADARRDARMAQVAREAWHQRATVTEPAADGEPDTPALIALPLRHNGVAIGAFVLARQGEASLTADVWSLLTIFTNVAAATFANQQLIDRLSMRTEELERLVDERTGQLRHSRDMLRIVFDNLPDGLVLTDVNANILTANNTFCRAIFGRRPQEVVGKVYCTLVAELAHRDGLRIEAVPPGNDGAQRVRSTDVLGQERWYSIDRLLIGAAEHSGQYLERWRDVTNQQQLERRLIDQQQITMLGDLVVGIVHELGNPLQSVRGCMDLMREEAETSAPAREYLALADAEIVRVGSLLARLRSLYRDLNQEPLDTAKPYLRI